MGYSCDAAAAHTMDAIRRGGYRGALGAVGAVDGEEGGDIGIAGGVALGDIDGETLLPGGFDVFDGRHAVIGIPADNTVDDDGKVTRFPGLPAPLLRQAEQIGKQTYQRDHGPIAPRDWRKDRAGIIACLDDGVPHEYLRDDVQACTKAYQTDKGIAFLVLPALNTSQAIVDFLNGL